MHDKEAMSMILHRRYAGSIRGVQGRREAYVYWMEGCVLEEPGQEALLGVVKHELQPCIGPHVLHHGIKDRRAGAQEHKAAPA